MPGDQLCERKSGSVAKYFRGKCATRLMLHAVADEFLVLTAIARVVYKVSREDFCAEAADGMLISLTKRT